MVEHVSREIIGWQQGHFHVNDANDDVHVFLFSRDHDEFYSMDLKSLRWRSTLL